MPKNKKGAPNENSKIKKLQDNLGDSSSAVIANAGFNIENVHIVDGGLFSKAGSINEMINQSSVPVTNNHTTLFIKNPPDTLSMNKSIFDQGVVTAPFRATSSIALNPVTQPIFETFIKQPKTDDSGANMKTILDTLEGIKKEMVVKADTDELKKQIMEESRSGLSLEQLNRIRTAISNHLSENSIKWKCHYCQEVIDAIDSYEKIEDYRKKFSRGEYAKCSKTSKPNYFVIVDDMDIVFGQPPLSLIRTIDSTEVKE